MSDFILVIVPKKPLLSEKQFDRLSEFSSNLSVVSFASTVLPVFLGLDKFDPVKILLGTIVGLILLITSLWFLKNNMNLSQPATQLDIFYLTLAVVGLIVVLMALPTLVHRPKESSRKATVR